MLLLVYIYTEYIRVGCSALLYLGSTAYIEPIKDIETPRVYVKEATTELILTLLSGLAERFWSHRDFTLAEVLKPPGLSFFSS